MCKTIHGETLSFLAPLSHHPPLQVCQSHSAAFEAESTGRGARGGVAVFFIPSEEGMKAKQGLSIFPVCVLPKHASGPGSAAPTSTRDLGCGYDLEILEKRRDWALPESRLQLQ